MDEKIETTGVPQKELMWVGPVSLPTQARAPAAKAGMSRREFFRMKLTAMGVDGHLPQVHYLIGHGNHLAPSDTSCRSAISYLP